jgi:hypothetical protein
MGFTLRTLYSGGPDAPPLHSIALFPWNKLSIQQLWGSQCNDFQDEWKPVCEKFERYIAVGGMGELRVYEMSLGGQWRLLHCVTFPESVRVADGPTHVVFLKVTRSRIQRFDASLGPSQG